MSEKDEALARGVNVEDTKHSMKRRAKMHDYNARGMYMLTLVVEGREPLLGRLCGESEEVAHVELTPLGLTIRDEEVKKISLYFPQIDVLAVCVMPDHLHMILFVRKDLPKGVHLGHVLGGFKAGCSKAWWVMEKPSAEASGTLQPHGSALGGSQPLASGGLVPCASALGSLSPSRRPLFERGYNDKLLLHEGQLANWKAYLDENAQRLWLKRRNPEAFTVLHDCLIAGRKCQVVGNRFLLSIPDKVAVIVHRRYTDVENARLREEWLACGERGGVLVSAAIAPKEKKVLREAMDRGYRIILLRENGFPDLYKPSGEAFYACADGLLLQISPWEFHMQQQTITRSQCLELNRMAEDIAAK